MAGTHDVYILGVSMTPFGKLLDTSVKQLSQDAVSGVLADAGLATEDIDAVVFATFGQGFLEGQTGVPGQVALRGCGLGGIPVLNVENACASGSTALYAAVNQVRSGAAEVCLALGVEKMYVADRAATISLLLGALDVHDGAGRLEALRSLVADVADPDDGPQPERQRNQFMEIYSALAKSHMRDFGLTQQQLAMVAEKNHANSVHNPLSQFREALTEAEVLASPIVAWPLTRAMCCPISDGAAAAIVCTGDLIRHRQASRAVRVEAIVLASAGDRDFQDRDRHVTRRAARRAYEIAGLGPEDMSVAEVHDATAMGEIIQVENLGFCELGAGGTLSESGATRLDGRIPVNPSGGLESKGHPVGATGLGQVYELVTQLRGEAGQRQVETPRFAIAENGGGFDGVEEYAAVITILGKMN